MNGNIIKRRGFKVFLLLVMMVCAPMMNVRTASAATTTTTKVSTKTTKLKSKSKAEKSYSKTSSKTTTKKSTSSTASQKTVKTVKTTVKTTNKYTKGSKVYKHTVKTTVKTTTTTTAINASSGNSSSSGNSATSTSTTTASQSSGSGENPYTYYMEKADKALVKAFETLGFSVQLKSGVNYSGLFDAGAQSITLRSSTDDTILHELGHFLSFVTGNTDATTEFASIYATEKAKYTRYDAAYVTQNASEYFAESYRDYVNDPEALKTSRPLTYAYLQKCLEKVTDSQVSKIATMYASIWK